MLSIESGSGKIQIAGNTVLIDGSGLSQMRNIAAGSFFW